MIEINNLIKARISQNFLKKTIQAALKKLKIKKAEISIALVDRKTIQRLNKIYRGIDKKTDVLSFDYRLSTIDYRQTTGGKQQLSVVGCQSPVVSRLSSVIQGEIIICYPQAKQQAKERGCAVEEEVKFLLTHGLLHLLGYNHEEMSNVKI